MRPSVWLPRPSGSSTRCPLARVWRSLGAPNTCSIGGTRSGRPGTPPGSRMPVGVPSPVQEAAAGLAPILRVAPRTMATRIHTAQTLSGLPRTAAMAWAGDLESYRAGVITGAAREVAHEQLTEFEARLHHGDIRDLPGSRVKARASLIAARLAPDPTRSTPTSRRRAARPTGRCGWVPPMRPG